MKKILYEYFSELDLPFNSHKNYRGKKVFKNLKLYFFYK